MINIGILGTGRVASYALIEPAKFVEGIRVVAVASRSAEKARNFAAAHDIPNALSAYDALMDDKDIDAVYVTLPTALHPAWIQRALEHGKHVLCEKPLAPSAASAHTVADIAIERNLILQEGMHMLFNRSLHRQRELLASGAFGKILHTGITFRHPNIPMIEGDFRTLYSLGGGAALDLGCYAVACLTYICPDQHVEVVDARAQCIAPNVDGWMQANVALASGATATIEVGFRGDYQQAFCILVTCENGHVNYDGKLLSYSSSGHLHHETAPPTPTYQLQLSAFAEQIGGKTSLSPSLRQSVSNAHVIDAMYQRAGLAPRPMLPF